MEEWIRWSVGIVVGAVLAILAWLGVGRVQRIEEDLKEVRSDMETYKENCGIGKATLEALSQKISEHIDREETILWEEIRNDRRMNNETHEKLVGALSIITGRIVAVETILDERLPAKVHARKRK
jgi:uncharacterized membrane-anchored protein YhcB (DUF1043 family)